MVTRAAKIRAAGPVQADSDRAWITEMIGIVGNTVHRVDPVGKLLMPLK